MKPCIICVAITGSLPKKADNPAVPITVSERVESTHAAYEAGASIVHAHVRNDDETPSADPEKFARLMEGVRQHCPDMLIQLSTGGRSGAGKAQGGMLPLKPDMASLSNAVPADRNVFDYYIRTVQRLLPGSEWCAAGIGPHQITLNEWCVGAGGHARTGLEDNVRLDRSTLAPSNAALVRRVVDICNRHQRPVATPAEARAILGL